MSEITDANQLRGAEFKKLTRRPLTWILTLLEAAVLAALAGFLLGPFFAGIGFAVGILVGLLVAFAIADNRAENAFYDSFAKSHGLTRRGSGALKVSRHCSGKATNARPTKSSPVRWPTGSKELWRFTPTPKCQPTRTVTAQRPTTPSP